MSEISIAKKATGGRRLRLGHRLGAVLLLANVSIWALLLVIYIAVPGALRVALVGGGIVFAMQLAILLGNSGIRAVARQTLSQCVRMKVAVAFIILLAGSLLLVAARMQGDGTLAGQVRTFLSYSTFLTSLLLSMVTIFLGASLVSNDIRDKHIFLSAAKPLSRWQYILGRWLGLVMLNIILLVIAGVAIYSYTQHIRSQQQINGKAIEAVDRVAVETEVFSSRGRGKPERVDLEQIVDSRLQKLQEEPTNFRSTLNEYKTKYNLLTIDAAYDMLREEYRKQAVAQAQSVAALPAELASQIPEQLFRAEQNNPPWARRWTFKNVKAAGNDFVGACRVKGVAMEDKVNGVMLLQFQADSRTMGQLLYGGPLRVDHLKGRVERILDNAFWVGFLKTEVTQADIDILTDGKEAHLVIEPTIQLTYKITGTYDEVRSLWMTVNPTTNMHYVQWRFDPPNMQITLTVPASAADDAGNMNVYFINRSNFGFSIVEDDVSALYRVDGFGWNFLRSILLILLGLMFLAALAVLAGSIVSFPVACLLSFAVLPFALAREFLAQAVGQMATDYATLARLSGVIVDLMKMVLPDLQRTSPGDALVGGLDLSWTFVGETAFMQVAVRTLLALILACVIFEKRELARVQV